MQERISLTSEVGRSFEIFIKKEIKIPKTRWGMEEKSFVIFDVNGQERSLFTRRVEKFCLPTLVGFNFDKDIDLAENYITAWKILKDMGFNVVSEVWKMGGNRVATTNLIEYGGSVYDQKIDSVVERDTLEMDKVFIQISAQRIQEQAERLTSLANKQGVELMPDGPFHIFVNSDTSWELSFLDIGKVIIYKNPKNLDREGKKINIARVYESIQKFAKIQENIKTLRQARHLD